MPPEPFKRNATLADLDALPETLTGELIDGDLWAFPRPGTPHASVQVQLVRGLGPPSDDDSPSGWVILTEVDLLFGPNCLVPDLVGWRRTRMPRLPDVARLELRPDWVCEIMSPSTGRRDRGPKRQIYATAGVPYLWYVDPVLHSLEALVLDGATYRLVASSDDTERGRFVPFESLELDVSRLWRR